MVLVKAASARGKALGLTGADYNRSSVIYVEHYRLLLLTIYDVLLQRATNVKKKNFQT